MSEEVKVSNSKAKREQRKKEAQKKKSQEARAKVIEYIIGGLVILAIVAIIGTAIVKRANRVVASDDYSAGLDANGYITAAKAEDIFLPDYKNISVSLSEIEYSDEEIAKDIESALNANKITNTDTSLTVADGDEVNIDYVGSVDGVEFDGGTAEGYDLEIGSGTFIPGFEEQLIGASVGSNFDINVTFPEDYNGELAGKDAVFNITVNGINEVGEFTDEFVQEYLGDFADSVEGYKQYLKDSHYDENLENWLTDYLEANTELVNYDKKYLKALKSTMRNDDEKSYETMGQIYEQYYGSNPYDSFESYMEMTEDEYAVDVENRAKEQYKKNFLYQAILQLEGATVDAAYYDEVKGEGSYENAVSNYGAPYALQSVFKDKVIELVKPMVNVQ